ncbi:hypothetical protein H2201_004826 [Coniosporium apollinis]|uniref:K Homology domain-containing protein n=1 Tax=Coniosporium apollinis TaxID=61459 RepID=A0ABQ9NRZ9_9PEZI|nr:hypothetical protein H2201_004826 [Coniosporium apollinis]
MADEPRKRSRFDQTEPEPKRPSRFDRRSRSPSAKKSDSRRSRSPIGRGSRSPASKSDPAAAAAAAAARINAQIQAKKGIQHVDVPPIRSTGSPAAVKSPSTSGPVSGEVYTQDGDYIKDIEVNDLRNRYTLTKGPTQKMIKEETGADVTTRGEYYPDKSMATAAAPPLYLHVTSTTKEGLEKAVAKIEELMRQELPNLVDERRFRRREPEQFERDEFGRRKWPEERIPVDLEPIPGFNLRAQVVGHGGAYVKHIQAETRCRVQIKGRGSGFLDNATGQESDEPMYLHVAGPDPNEVKRARDLCLDLLDNVKQQYERFKERGPSHDRGYSGGGGGGYQNGGHRGSYGDRQQHDSYNGGYSGGYGGAQSPYAASAMSPAAQTPGTPASATPGTDYAAQYAQYYGGQDPYAAYGGYQNYMNMYYQYYQQQQPGGVQSPPPGASSAPPPPSEAPPPPPPGGSAPPPPPSGPPPGGYNAVPPPPGM